MLLRIIAINANAPNLSFSLYQTLVSSIPANVGITDTASEVLHAALRGTSKVKTL